MSRRVVHLFLAILIIPFTCFADGHKLEQTGEFTGQGASESIRKSLEAKGHRIVGSDGNVLCEIWLRSGVPAGKTETPGAAYTTIGESTLIGAVVFPKNAFDFRGQQVKAGAYTLRYALYPPDGNHLGISPIRDFLVLIPVSVDQNADAQYKFDELTKMSAKTTGANHPAVISLVTAGAKPGASVSENDHGHVVFSSSIKSANGSDMPISFIVKGVAEQ